MNKTAIKWTLQAVCCNYLMLSLEKVNELGDRKMHELAVKAGFKKDKGGLYSLTKA